jgi:signal transduction histidine kinase
MRERIHELGGVFEVTSDGRGTAVRAAIPLSSDHSPMSSGAEELA